MYHQGYGTHRYLPETSAAAAAAAYYHYQQQQQRICLQGKMEDSAEAPAQVKPPKPRAGERGESPEEQKGGVGDGAAEKEAQPAEAEYLSSRCVLFTYFQGDIGDVVDEHFSRALSQASALPAEPHSGVCEEQEASYHQDSVPISHHPSGAVAIHRRAALASPPSIRTCRPAPSFIQWSTERGWGTDCRLRPLPLTAGRTAWEPRAAAATPTSTRTIPVSTPRHAHHVVHHTFGSALDPRLPGTCPPCSPATHGGISKTEAGTSSGPPHGWHISHQAPMDNTYELSE
ncbi:hypothetical protein ANANG_G00066310 [Anguilla anguilla]|uniref:Transcription cofactor vestigial-like protein 3 n=1 Tax=Anguilla anguilla TaxID=7936 RepID=A0A9D3S5L3_ANGAN|nr:hypothetical protein ANANG_G00066310 [Anguilla anguilla]